MYNLNYSIVSYTYYHELKKKLKEHDGKNTWWMMIALRNK